eukprot:5990885-Alexandrium_andersonii.AAC.1
MSTNGASSSQLASGALPPSNCSLSGSKSCKWESSTSTPSPVSTGAMMSRFSSWQRSFPRTFR